MIQLINLEHFYQNQVALFEEHYLKNPDPWRQSGFSGPYERWVACRKPIADAIRKEGDFLDIGCANGYLLQSILEWVKHRNLSITPYGIDISQKLIELARNRLSKYAENFVIDNAQFAIPSRKFQYVRTELCYIPIEYQSEFVKRLLKEFIADDGELLVCEYRSSKDTGVSNWVNEILLSWGFNVTAVHSGFWEEKELTRVAVVRT